MNPYCRAVLHPTFGCVALTFRGTRCGRRHYTECPVTFAWDPIHGVGISGPDAPFCRMHNYLWDLSPEDRIEVVGGWFGRVWNERAKCWTVNTTVYAERDGFRVSLHWWDLRRETRFGDCVRVPYDKAEPWTAVHRTAREDTKR